MAFNNVLRKGLSASCFQLQLEMVGERLPAAFGGSPLTEGENKALNVEACNLPLVRGRRERSERGGRSHTISNCSAALGKNLDVFKYAHVDLMQNRIRP